MSQTSEVSIDPSRKAWHLLFVVQILAMTLVGCYCTWSQRYLYADGSNFFIKMLQYRQVMDFDPARRFAHLVMEFPTVFLLRDLQCRDIGLVGLTYGATLYLTPVIGLILTWWAARKAPAHYWMYPMLSQLIMFLDVSFEPLDIHVATWIFWCVMYLLIFPERLTLGVSALLLALAVLSTCVYETYLFLAWPLVICACHRGRAAWKERSFGELATSAACLLLFLVGFANALHSTVVPRDEGNRANFAVSMVLHLAYPPVWYSLLAMACACWSPRSMNGQRAWRVLRRVTFGCGLVVALLPFAGFVMPPLQHIARVQGLYVPLILAGFVLLKAPFRNSASDVSAPGHGFAQKGGQTGIAHQRGQTPYHMETITNRATAGRGQTPLVGNAPRQDELWGLIAWTCAVAVCFQCGATYQWNRYRGVLLADLAEQRGVVPYEEFQLASPVYEQLLYSEDYRSVIRSEIEKEPGESLKRFALSQFNFGFGWTLPSQSIALSALNLGTVTTIIEAPASTGWQPFNPRDPSAIPDLGDFGISTNLQARQTSP